jgi:hypothetical protein
MQRTHELGVCPSLIRNRTEERTGQILQVIFPLTALKSQTRIEKVWLSSWSVNKQIPRPVATDGGSI